MSGRMVRTPGRSITARPSPTEKARFSTLAQAAGISESRLALMAIRAFVDGEGRAQEGPECDPAAERVTATDLAAMARAHIAADPPLFTHELAALKQSIATLAGLGLLLGQNVRSPAPSVAGLEEVRQTLSRTRA